MDEKKQKDDFTVTVDDVKAELGRKLDEMREARSKGCAVGKRYRRTPYDSLGEKGLLTPDALVREYDLIADNKSRLSAAERDWVWRLCTAAMFAASTSRAIPTQSWKSTTTTGNEMSHGED